METYKTYIILAFMWGLFMTIITFWQIKHNHAQIEMQIEINRSVYERLNCIEQGIKK